MTSPPFKTSPDTHRPRSDRRSGQTMQHGFTHPTQTTCGPGRERVEEQHINTSTHQHRAEPSRVIALSCSSNTHHQTTCHSRYRCRLLDMTLEDKLTTAAATGNTVEVEDLLRAGAPVNGLNCYGHTALQVMMMGSSPVAQVLLTHGADPSVTDGSTGATPLHDAARTGFLDTVRLLVQFLADPQAKDNTNNRPIDLARDSGHTDVVDFLQAL